MTAGGSNGAMRGWGPAGGAIAIAERGAACRSRVEAGPGRGGARLRAAEFDPVMQPVGAILPEFHHGRGQPVANPEWRARPRPDGKFRRMDGDRLLEGEAAFERARLPARPGADLRSARPAREIGVGLNGGDCGDGAAQPDLSAQ